jgi:phage/plasmid-like protein (TIGR03299 family)
MDEEELYSSLVLPWEAEDSSSLSIQGADDLDAALLAADLDWEADSRPLLYRDPDDKKNLIEVETHKGVVRDDTLDLIGVVGVNYEIVQNREALSLLRGIAGRGKDLTFNRGGTFNNGSVVWVMLSIDDFLIEPVPGDVIVPYIVISNSHDGTQGVRATFVSHRHAGLGMHHVGKGLSFRHTKNVVDRMERGENVLAAGMDAFERFQDFAMDLAQRPMLDEDWGIFLDEFVPPPDEDNLRPGRRNKARDTLTTLFVSGPGTEIPGVKHTRWAALSAVSTWLTHFSSSRGGEGALNSLWFKANASKLEHAAHLLRKLRPVR